MIQRLPGCAARLGDDIFDCSSLITRLTASATVLSNESVFDYGLYIWPSLRFPAIDRCR